MDSPLDRDPTATVTRDRDPPYHLRFKPSDSADKAWKNPTIVVRSSRDRSSFAAESPLLDPTTIDRDLGPLLPNRGPIVVLLKGN